jgi:hypothetical protein
VLEAKTDKGFDVMGGTAVYIGHEEGSNAYKCYVPELTTSSLPKTSDSRNVVDVFETQRTPIERESDFHQTERS